MLTVRLGFSKRRWRNKINEFFFDWLVVVAIFVIFIQFILEFGNVGDFAELKGN